MIGHTFKDWAKIEAQCGLEAEFEADGENGVIKGEESGSQDDS